MAIAKTTMLNFHFETGLKEALRTAVDREHRSIAPLPVRHGGNGAFWQPHFWRPHSCHATWIGAVHDVKYHG